MSPARLSLGINIHIFDLVHEKHCRFLEYKFVPYLILCTQVVCPCAICAFYFCGAISYRR